MNSAILLVDVASAGRDSWKSFLRSQNYEVFTAEDGESALRQCVQLQPDLVLLYDTLPDVGGLGLCRRMKRNPLNHQIPIVLIKPSSDAADAARGREAGAADFWGVCSSPADALGHVRSLLRLKSYIDEQAKCVMLSLARNIHSRTGTPSG
jgi:DNA-binding response OmpR family regulator